MRKRPLRSFTLPQANQRNADYPSTWTHLSNTIGLSFPEAEADDDVAKLS